MKVRELILALLEECVTIDDEVEIVWASEPGVEVFTVAYIARKDIKQTTEGSECVIIEV
jgi:hypothetical protein